MTERVEPVAANAAPHLDEARRIDLALRLFAGALFAVLAFVSAWMSGPLVHGDEGSYLLNAAAIAGKLQGGLGAGYYSGYSLLFVPAYLLFHDYAWIYHYALLVNAALLASLPFALRRILRCVTPSAGPFWHAFAAAVATCQIAILANSQNALSENALIPAYAWMLAYGAAMLSRRTLRDAVICGALAGALFLVHPRGATMAAPVLFAFSLPSLRDRGLRVPTTCLLVVAVLAALSHAPLEWLAAKTGGAKMQAYSIELILARYASLAAWGQALFAAVGASLYLAIASVGLLLLALREAAAQMILAWRDRHAGLSPASAMVMALLGGLAVSILVTAVYLTPPDRVDHLLYGRYALPSVVPLVALGVTRLRTFDRSRLPAAWQMIALMLVAITLMGLAFSWFPHPASNFWVHVNAIDLYVPFMLAGRIDWPTIGFYFCLLAFAMYSAACFVSGKLGGLLFAALGICVSAYITADITLPSNALRARGRQAVTALRDFERSTATPVCVGIAAEIDGWHMVDYENWLYDRIDQSKVVDRTRCVRGLVASMTTNRPSPALYRLIAAEMDSPYGLFVRKSAAVDMYVEAHALPPADFPAPLPDSERSAKVEVPGIGTGVRLRAGKTFTFDVRITHDQGSMIWPPLFDISAVNAVRVGARVDSLGDGDPHNEFRAELPRPLKPGESATVSMTIGPMTKPGRYTVIVGVLQEAVAWFESTQQFTVDIDAP